MKIRKTIWRTADGSKDLVSLEPGKITVHAYDMLPQQLPELIRALEEVLEITTDTEPPKALEVRHV